MAAIDYQALLVKYMAHMRDRDPTSWLPSDDDPGFTRDDIDELDRLAEPLVVDLRESRAPLGRSSPC